jgi:nitrate/TMAO reductase-like tetraheme cytochrome c subunit
MKKFFVILALALPFTLQFCNTSKKSKNVAPPKITYMTNVQPTIVANCSPCHIPPKGFKKALNTYDSAKNSIDDMISRVQMQPGDKGFMPFKHPRLADSTILVFVNWKKDGLLEK